MKPGARRIKTGGVFANSVAFKNKNGSVVVVTNNSLTTAQTVALWCNGKSCSVVMPAKSFSTFVVEGATSAVPENSGGSHKARAFFASYSGHALYLVPPPGGAACEVLVTSAAGRTVFRARVPSAEKTVSILAPFSPGLYYVSARNSQHAYQTRVLIF